MRVEELHSSLEAQELCLIERNSKRETKQSFQASFGQKNKKQAWLKNKKNNGGGAQKS